MNSPYHLVGPVLPQALRLARYQASATLPQNVDDLQSENDTINQTPSHEEERLLVSNSNVMNALEDLFSWRQKDRTCRASKLSRVESVRFQRAMYRIWLMSVLFGPRRAIPSAVPLSTHDIKEIWRDQKAFLQQFSSRELFQISILARFLRSTAHWAATAEDRVRELEQLHDWRGMALFAGPHTILRCHEDATTTIHLSTKHLGDSASSTEFLTHALSEIFQERKVKEPFGFVGFILDDIFGVHDRCRRCGTAGAEGCPGFELQTPIQADLYNETNWDDLKGRLDHDSLVPENLRRNKIEEPSFTKALRGDWSTLVHEMFASRLGGYAQWSKQDWVCTFCWSLFFKDTLWQWLSVQKRRAREPIPERDCRYGYDCREQCFDNGLAHAKQFNHLCKPIEERLIQE